MLFLMLLLLLVLSVATTTTAQQQDNNDSTTTTTLGSSSSGIQSHFGDVTYVASVDWNGDTNALTVVGQVGQNGCFMGVLPLKTTTTSFQWVSKQTLPEPALCQGVVSLPVPEIEGEENQPQAAVLLSATTEEGGYLTDQRTVGSTKATQYGILTPLWYYGDDYGTSALPPNDDGGGALLLHDDVVQYPRAMVVDPKLHHYVYVATMQSSDSKMTQEFLSVTDKTPNLTPSGINFKYGSSFVLNIERIWYQPDKPQELLTRTWRKLYGTDAITTVDTTTGGTESTGGNTDTTDTTEGNNVIAAHPSVMVNAMIWNSDTLMVVGNTHGSGPAFGGENDDDATTVVSEMMNGFVTKFDPNTGKLYEADGHTTTRQFSFFDNTQQKEHTYMESICSAADDVNAPEVYVVGVLKSMASGNQKAFVAKFNAMTLSTIWQQELILPLPDDNNLDNSTTTTTTTITNTYAVACGVDATRNVVYVAGSIQTLDANGSTPEEDVFVTQLNADTAEIVWTQTIGTPGHVERLAHTPLIVTPTMVVVVGTTTGNLYHPIEQASEIFVTLLNPDDGTTAPPSSGTTSSSTADIPITIPTQNNGATTGSSGSDNSGTTTVSTPAPTPTTNTDSSNNNNTMDTNNKEAKPFTENGIWITMIVVVIPIFICGYWLRCQKQRRKEQVTERAAVFSYLQAFDLEDVDVRHSATGGWHGTYVGALAQGEHGNKPSDRHIGNIAYRDDHDHDHDDNEGDNNGKNATTTTTTTNHNNNPYETHSSLIKDSLFVDYEATPPSPTDSAKDENQLFNIDDDDDDDDDEDDDFENVPTDDDKPPVDPDNPWGRDII